MNNSNLLQHYKGYELLISQLQQAAERYQRSGVNIALNFLGLDSIKVTESYLGNSLPYRLIGGYQAAFSKRLVIGEQIDEQQYVCLLEANFNNKFLTITHKDVLGALYGLQIDKNRFGDLWVEDNNIYLYCEKEIANYLINNFTQINKANVSFKEVEFREQIFKFEGFKIVSSSLRLDSVVSDIVRKSREKAKELIKQSMVNVDYKTIEDCSFLCNNGNVLSIRGFGRYKISDIQINNKNKKYNIYIERFV